MKTRKVVHGKNLATRCPLVATLVFWLVLDKLDAAGWVWGAVGAVDAGREVIDSQVETPNETPSLHRMP